MRNNKLLVSSFLTLTLLSLVVCGATYSLFTVHKEHTIDVNTGNISITPNISSLKTWSINEKEPSVGTTSGISFFTNQGSASINENNQLILNNLTPGDNVKARISINNKSSIPIQYRVKVIIEGELNDAITTTISLPNSNGVSNPLIINSKGYTSWIESSSTGIIENDIKISFPANKGNEYQNKDCIITFVIEAIQRNAYVHVSAIDELKSILKQDYNCNIILDNDLHITSTDFENMEHDSLVQTVFQETQNNILLDLNNKSIYVDSTNGQDVRSIFHSSSKGNIIFEGDGNVLYTTVGTTNGMGIFSSYGKDALIQINGLITPTNQSQTNDPFIYSLGENENAGKVIINDGQFVQTPHKTSANISSGENVIAKGGLYKVYNNVKIQDCLTIDNNYYPSKVKIDSDGAVWYQIKEKEKNTTYITNHEEFAKMIRKGGKVVLTEDIIFTSSDQLFSGMRHGAIIQYDTTLDLNGYNIVYDIPEVSDSTIFYAYSGEFNIIGEGSVTAANSTCVIWPCKNSKGVNIYGGTYQVINKVDSQYPFNIFYSSGGDLRVYNATIIWDKDTVRPFNIQNSSTYHKDQMIFYEGTIFSHNDLNEKEDDSAISIQEGCYLKEILIDGKTFYQVTKK